MIESDNDIDNPKWWERNAKNILLFIIMGFCFIVFVLSAIDAYQNKPQ